MEDGVDAEDFFGEDGLLRRMKKRMAERITVTVTHEVTAWQSRPLYEIYPILCPE